MCGIVAYTGEKLCKQIVLDGLAQLEYKGYDSAGFVCIDSSHNHFSYQKEAGGVAPVGRLIEAISFDGFIGMGHTRWATHGAVDQNNAHPHFNCKKSIAIVHNGIIENHEKLRQQLIARNHTLFSATDSEVVAHFFSELLDEYKDLRKALIALTKHISGAYGLVMLLEQYPDTLVIVRRRSPLLVGIGKNEMFVASDFASFPNKNHDIVFVPDNTFGIVQKNNLELYSYDGKPVPYFPQELNPARIDDSSSGFEHFMLKEIYEQKRAIIRTISFCKIIGSYSDGVLGEPVDTNAFQQLTPDYNGSIWRQMGLTSEKIKNVKQIHFVSAATSWHAARIAQFFFEHICGVPTHVHLASEFRYRPFFAQPDSLYFMISQSGETADTLEALRLVNSFEQPTIAVTNVASSTMVREASGFLPMQAGPELSVVSTKTFSTQLALLYWLANRMALEHEKITAEQMNEAEENILVAAEILEATIEMYKYKIISELAEKYAQFEKFIFLGRHISYPFALEAALKFKEVACIFAQGYPAGEFRHGPVALITDGVPVVLFSVLDDLIYQKMVDTAKDVKNHNGHLIVFAFEGQDELIGHADTVFILPRVSPLLAPLAMAGLVHFFVYHITCYLGRPVDRPRNLSKAVVSEE